jgi:hypothetical protein
MVQEIKLRGVMRGSVRDGNYISTFVKVFKQGRKTLEPTIGIEYDNKTICPYIYMSPFQVWDSETQLDLDLVMNLI